MRLTVLLAAFSLAMLAEADLPAADYYWELVTTGGQNIRTEAYTHAIAAVTGDINGACPYTLDWDQGDDYDTDSDGGLGATVAEVWAAAVAYVGANYDNPECHAKITAHPVTGTPSLVGFLSRICARDEASLQNDGDESYPTNTATTRYRAQFDRKVISASGGKIYIDYHYCWCGSRLDYHGVNGGITGFDVYGFFFYGGSGFTYPTVYWIDNSTLEEHEEFGDPHLNQIGSFDFQYEYEPPANPQTPHRIGIDLESAVGMLWYNLEQGYDCVSTVYDDHIKTKTELNITTD